MTEKVIDNPPNGVEKETIITQTTANDNGVVDEVELVIERGEAKAISLEQIEKGLTALWQAAAKPRKGDHDGHEEQPVMRACVFNLVICIDGEQYLSDVTETIARITWSYPCRAIVLVRLPDDPSNSTSATISAHCQLPTASGKKVCCEQITVYGTGSEADGLWSMVLPLLVPDLPVMMWWPGDPGVEGNLFLRLLEVADRLIVDSRVFQQPARTFAHLAGLAQGRYADTGFSDLSWARLTPWRNLLAQFFDLPEYLLYLDHVNGLEIHYEAPDDNDHPNFSEALLLVGWLARQLGWQPAFNLQPKGANATLILNQHGSPLTVTLTGHNDRVDDEGGITRVSLSATRPLEHDQSQSARFTIALTEDFERATTMIEVEGQQTIQRSILFPRRDQMLLLCEDLAIVGRDRQFEAALELAGQFSQK